MSVAQGLPESAERPQPIQDVPLWSENLCFTGWDRERGIGVFVHTGRTPIDPELWHEIVALHLPGGRVLVGKNFSRGESADGPTGSLLTTQCLEPFRAWSIAFNGPLRSVGEDELAAAALADGPQPGVRLDLRFDSDLPVWDFGSHGAGDWARRHYQQLGTLKGTLATDDLETHLTMEGWRDHSAGVRNMAPFLRHVLVTAQFDDGRSLYAVQLEDSGSERPFVLGRLGDASSVTDLQMVSLPPIDDVRAPSPIYQFALGPSSGPVTVRAEMQCILPVTMFPPNDMVIGVASGPGAYVLWMGQARFDLDGVTGYGHVERAGRLG
jgi:hypothetical protein